MGARRHHHPVVEVLIGRGWRAAASLVLVSGGLAACASGPAGAVPNAADAASAAPIAPFYTVEQATRGERVFGTVCSACHSRNEFSGPIFAITWMEEPVGHLFQHVSTAMPQDRPGSLSDEEYAAVVAYILRLNGRPAGERQLPVDVGLLGRMRW